MIHHTPEGGYLKLGLNFRRAPGGFCLMWVWYDIATYTATTYRFRLRLHMKPRIMWSATEWNVIENHLMLNDLALVNREWLEDTKASWRDKLRRDKAAVQFGP
jgi:hypothetical protein